MIEAIELLQTSLQSEREWRNIQEKVKTTFEGVIKVLMMQAKTIAALEVQLHQYCTCTDEKLSTSMKNIQESLIVRVDEQIEKNQREEMCRYEARNQREEMHAAVIQQERQQRTEEWNQLQHEIEKIVKGQSYLEQRLSKQMETRVSDLEIKLNRLDSNLSSQLINSRQEVAKVFQDVPRRNELKLIGDQIIKLESLVTEGKSHIDQLTTNPSHQQSIEQLRRDLDVMMENIKNTKADMSDINQAKRNLNDLITIVETMQHEQSTLKGSIKELTRTTERQIEIKPVVVRLHDSIKLLHKSMETTVKQDELARLNEQVQSMRKQVRSEIYQARFLWKEGRPSPQQTIRWTTQVINTNTHVFVWKSGCDTISTTLPGLYHLQAVFFTCFTPSIQVLVNGEPAAVHVSHEYGGIHDPTSDNITPNCKIDTGSGAVRRLRHSDGNLAGVDLTVFLALPAHAVLSITYDIDERAQGFLNLRKL